MVAAPPRPARSRDRARSRRVRVRSPGPRRPPRRRLARAGPLPVHRRVATATTPSASPRVDRVRPRPAARGPARPTCRRGRARPRCRPGPVPPPCRRSVPAVPALRVAPRRVVPVGPAAAVAVASGVLPPVVGSAAVAAVVASGVVPVAVASAAAPRPVARAAVAVAAVAVAAVRRVPSGVRVADRPGVASPRSSADRNSTTCRRRP